MENSNTTQISAQNINRNLHSLEVNISSLIKEIFQFDEYSKKFIEQYDKFYDDFHTSFIKQNQSSYIYLNNYLNFKSDVYSPYNFVIESHLLLILFYLLRSGTLIEQVKKYKDIKLEDLLLKIDDDLTKNLIKQLFQVYSVPNKDLSLEFYNKFNVFLNNFESDINLLSNAIDNKIPFLYYLDENLSETEVNLISKIKSQPLKMITTIKFINYEAYQFKYKEYYELTNLIYNLIDSKNANVFFCLLKEYNRNINLEDIDKSKSIRAFLVYFKIKEEREMKIVKAMSNINNDSDITKIIKENKAISTLFQNYFKKNNINFNQFIIKKINKIKSNGKIFH